MNRRMQIASAFLTALWVLSIFLARPAHAAQDDCQVNVGKEVPVLFVHGFNSGQNVWRSSDFENHVTAETKVTTDRFDYQPFSLQWVTDPHIGKALANHILCLAESSRNDGGTGKVVVVAHSMGGLATRQAIAENPAVAKVLGLVITIATPNNGSFIDRQAFATAKDICLLNPFMNCFAALNTARQFLTAFPGLSEGSKQIRELPDWPSSVPVYAIAGNIALHYNLFGLEWDATHSGNDALVTIRSALHGRKIGELGGNAQVRCPGGPPPLIVGWTNAPCEHSALVQNDTVQKLAVEQIKEYVRSTAAPTRKLPESCSPTVVHQEPGFTLKTNAQVTSGTVACKTALAVGKSFLEESGPNPVTKIGQWTCRVVSSNPSGGFIAECKSSEGGIRLDGE